MLTTFPEKSLDQRIRDEFERVGSTTATAPFVHHCREAGVWSDDEWETLAFREAQAVVRRALKAVDESGLQFAGQTSEKDEEAGGAIWKQRALWVYADYAINISEHIRQRDSNHWAAVALADECRMRYGQAPDVGFAGDVSLAAD